MSMTSPYSRPAAVAAPQVTNITIPEKGVDVLRLYEPFPNGWKMDRSAVPYLVLGKRSALNAFLNAIRKYSPCAEEYTIFRNCVVNNAFLPLGKHVRKAVEVNVRDTQASLSNVTCKLAYEQLDNALLLTSYHKNKATDACVLHVVKLEGSAIKVSPLPVVERPEANPYAREPTLKQPAALKSDSTVSVSSRAVAYLLKGDVPAVLAEMSYMLGDFSAAETWFLGEDRFAVLRPNSVCFLPFGAELQGNTLDDPYWIYAIVAVEDPSAAKRKREGGSDTESENDEPVSCMDRRVDHDLSGLAKFKQFTTPSCTVKVPGRADRTVFCTEELEAIHVCVGPAATMQAELDALVQNAIERDRVFSSDPNFTMTLTDKTAEFTTSKRLEAYDVIYVSQPCVMTLAPSEEDIEDDYQGRLSDDEDDAFDAEAAAEERLCETLRFTAPEGQMCAIVCLDKNV